MTITVCTRQQENVKNELQDRTKKKSEKKQQSRFHRLDPFVDGDGVLRVGGRLRRAELEFGENMTESIQSSYHEKIMSPS